LSKEKSNIEENEELVPAETEEAAETEEEVVQESAEPTCEEKLKAMEDKYLRTHAEFENIKKRLEREKYTAIDYASEKFAKDLLPAIDALEMALLIEDKEQFDKLKEGVQLTLDKLLDAFSKHDITPVSHDEGFDPNIHEAVMQVSSDEHEENAVVQVMQKGYKYKERVLRPSLVSINKK
jgi:molecular chaperone GrpE